jgi:hypothetical protein
MQAKLYHPPSPPVSMSLDQGHQGGGGRGRSRCWSSPDSYALAGVSHGSDPWWRTSWPPTGIPPPAIEHTTTAATPLTSFTPVAEDWREEGLAGPERPVLVAIADVQAVDFLAMAAAQRSCLEVKEMTNSDTLQITT